MFIVAYVPRPLSSSPVYETTKEYCESKDLPPTLGKRTAQNKKKFEYYFILNQKHYVECP
jgi:hypothetical protein